MKNFFMLFLIGTCILFKASAQPGAIDLTFNPADIGFGNGTNNSVNSITVQSDGKILIGGSFTSYNGISKNYITRLNSDGSLDTGFNIGTGANNTVNSIAIQSDGKILIGGEFTSYNGISRNKIARINSDGSLDTSFDPGTGANNWISSVAIQSDGKILIGGFFISYNGTSRNFIARLNSDGSLDTGFDPGTGVNNNVHSIAIQNDGKILIGGDFTLFNGTSGNHIARVNSDGSPDTGFNPGTGTDDQVKSIAIQSDGKILIGGFFTSYNGTSRNYIARINSDGSLDTGFDPGTGTNDAVYSIAVQSDGKILIGGNFASYNGTSRSAIARLNSGGSLDTGFPGINAYLPYINSIAVQSDGKILIGGNFVPYFGASRNYIARLDASGNMEAGFNLGTGADNQVKSIAVQGDGKILIGGPFAFYNGISRNGIARLNSDGSLDTSFDPGTGTNILGVYSVALQIDGKILIGGLFSSYNGITRVCIARLNSDGSLDNSFNPGSGTFYAGINSIVVQIDGKILIGGSFTSYAGTSRNYIARLNSDGSLDTGFNPGTGAAGGSYPGVNSIAIQSGGKILIGGSFTTYNGTSRNNIARLNSDGSLDTSFDPGTGAAAGSYPSVNSIAIQSDGNILIGGSFTTYNGTSRNHIARLNSDGSLDTSFDPGTGANSNVNSMALQSDGKILIVGFFSSYNGTSRNGITRLNLDGSLDNSFNPGTGTFYPSANSIAVQIDGNILIGGSFTSYNGTGRNRIARIMGNSLTGISMPVSVSFNAAIYASPNPFNNYTIIKSGNGVLLNNTVIHLYDANGNHLMSMTNLVPDEIKIERGRLVPGIYFYQIFSNNELSGSGKLMVQE